MLRFPLSPIPDPSQPLERLSPGIHQQISSWLDREGRSCELLDMVMKTVYVIKLVLLLWIPNQISITFFRNPGSFVTQQGNCTSAQLFSKLSRFNCKIGILAFFLEKCEMYEPLYLLKDRGTFFIWHANKIKKKVAI